MKISIVTAVLNRAPTIGAALASVSAQTHDRLEHIVQDGGSNDGTIRVLQDWCGTPRVNWKSQPDQGLYDALNRGIARCDGDVIGVLHSDDVFADRTVLADVAQALNTRDVDGVYGDLEMIGANGRVLCHWRAGPFHPARMRWGWAPPHPTLFLRSDVFNRLGMYDPTYRISGDYDAMLRWIWTGKIKLAYLPRVLVRMRYGGASTGSIPNLATKSVEDLRALRRHGAGGVGALVAKNLRKLGQFVPASPRADV